MKWHSSLRALAVASAFLASAVTWIQAANPEPAASPAGGPPKKTSAKPQPKVYPVAGTIERLDAALDALVAPGATIEKLVGGMEWAEGPVWNRKTRTLLFSDVPRNVIFEWREGVGTRDYLFPSGYTGSTPRGNSSGSNGLTFDAEGRLVICMHGDRLIGRLETTNAFNVLAAYYRGRRFNSPNDLVYRSNGDLYFSDPPYGLEKGNQDPAQELLFSGVYLLRRSGEVILLVRDLAFPNGLAFSPDEKTLYVAVSDPARPVVMAYPVKSDGTLGEGRVFFDAAPLAAGRQGLPDGLKVDVKGNVFATGPGGVLVLSPQGRHLGTLNPGETTANCAWGDTGSTLYLTANTHVYRVRTLTKGRLP